MAMQTEYKFGFQNHFTNVCKVGSSLDEPDWE